MKTPTYAVSVMKILALEIANPLVSSQLDFYPKDAHGRYISKFSQLRKWLESTDASGRAPMVRCTSGDYYIYEPVQLEDKRIVVPLFFYSMEGELWAKCITPVWTPESDGLKIRGTISSNLQFNSNQLEIIGISRFSCPYLEIVGENNVHLSEQCQDVLYGMSFFNSLAQNPLDNTLIAALLKRAQ
jgi:hypothetical protein